MFHISVALNFQTGGEEMQLLHGRFLDNGNSGYVLKPKCLQSGNITILLRVCVCVCGGGCSLTGVGRQTVRERFSR